jgi:molybdopterin converting factor small subunit
MNVKVSFFGATKAYTNNEVFVLEMGQLSTVADVIQKIIEEQPNTQKIIKFLFVSVNEKLVPRHYHVSDNDEIGLFFRPGGG